jgi:hypothetical protein
MPRRKRRRKKQFPTHRVIMAGVVIALLIFFWNYLRHGPPTKDFNARVLFSETASCSQEERRLVLGVMHNRIGNPAFGNPPTLDAVIRQPGAFSAIGDSSNANWEKSLYPDELTRQERAVWDECVKMLLLPPPDARGATGRKLVYYHDKSIDAPSSWRNEKWTAVREKTTPRFVFYSVMATK